MTSFINRWPWLYRPSMFGIAALCLWSVYRSVESGTVQGVYGSVIADRSSDPVMFWIYVAGMVALGVFMAAGGFGLVG